MSSLPVDDPALAPATRRRGAAAARAAAARMGAFRPALRVLTPPITRRRPSFVAVCTVIMVACLGTLLAVNIVLSRGAYEEQNLVLRQTALMETQQALSEDVARQGAPGVLSQRARSLGMIANSSPAFIRLTDGRIVGVPTPAAADKAPASADLSGGGLTPEQQAAAAAAANGGVAAVGAPNADQPVDPGLATPQLPGRPMTDPAGLGEPGAPAGALPAGEVGDGAVPVSVPISGGTGAVRSPSQASTGEGQAVPPDVQRGDAAVEAGR